MQDSRINRENGLKILDWCYEKLGKSRFNGPKPRLFFHKKSHPEKFWGYYYFSSNNIHVFKPRMTYLLEFIETIIHEYWHYKQNLKIYKKYHFLYGDDKNPYEIIAYKKGKQLKKKCYEDLFK